MIIRNMNASFGKLKNHSLSLQPGLNIIQAPNEAGKSTWSAFIRAMLYGINTAERDTAGKLADKNRYQPWDGSAMAGTMELEARGSRVTISRAPLRGAPFKDFSARYTGTDEPVQWLAASNAGEALTGVPEGVFSRTAFIRQAGIKVDGDPALEKRIAAIVSGGDENQSYAQTDSTLRAWQRKRRHNRSGQIPKLEAQMRTAEERLKLIQDLSRTLGDAQQELQRLEQRRDSYTEDMHKYAILDKQSAQQRNSTTGQTQFFLHCRHQLRQLFCAPVEDAEGFQITQVSKFHRNGGEFGNGSFICFGMVDKGHDVFPAAQAVTYRPENSGVLRTAIHAANSAAQHIPTQGIAAAAIINEMTVAATSGSFSGFVFSEADGSGSRDQHHTGAIHSTPKCDLLVAAEFADSPKTSLFQFLRQDLFYPGVGNACRADAEPGTVPHAAAPGKGLPQQRPESILSDGVQVKGAKFPTAEKTVFHVPQFDAGMGSAAVNSCDKHSFTSQFHGQNACHPAAPEYILQCPEAGRGIVIGRDFAGAVRKQGEVVGIAQSNHGQFLPGSRQGLCQFQLSR